MAELLVVGKDSKGAGQEHSHGQSMSPTKAGGTGDFISTKPRATMLGKAHVGERDKAVAKLPSHHHHGQGATGGNSEWRQC